MGGGLRFLLDTHAFLWALAAPEKLSNPVRVALENPATQIHVSSVSFFEIATKVRLGKLRVSDAVLRDWELTLARFNASVLDVAVSHAILAGSWEVAHRDPFDRLLAAQALVQELQLVSADPAMASFPGVRLMW